jgi:hypothetical protein
MEKWQVELKLKFRGVPWKIKVGFSFEWKAWLIAYDLFDVSIEEFQKLDSEEQMTALCYGAAYWDRMKKGKRIFFSYEDIIFALDKATKEENKQLGEALNYAHFPEWLKKGMPESKKKVMPE